MKKSNLIYSLGLAVALATSSGCSHLERNTLENENCKPKTEEYVCKPEEINKDKKNVENKNNSVSENFYDFTDSFVGGLSTDLIFYLIESGVSSAF